jgi:hypothetical protein
MMGTRPGDVVRAKPYTRFYDDPSCNAWSWSTRKNQFVLVISIHQNEYRQDVLTVLIDGLIKWVYNMDVT